MQHHRTPDAQKLHDRAAQSAKELRQAVLALSSGALAVFFLALTTTKSVEPALQVGEIVVLFLSLTSMAVAVFASLWSAHADAQWSYWWARLVEERPEDSQLKNLIPDIKDRHHWHKRVSEKVLVCAFAIGIFFGAIYLGSRIYALRTTDAPSAFQSAKPATQT